MGVDDFYKVPTLYSVLFKLTGLLGMHSFQIRSSGFSVGACYLIASSVAIAEDVPDIKSAINNLVNMCLSALTIFLIQSVRICGNFAFLHHLAIYSHLQQHNSTLILRIARIG